MSREPTFTFPPPIMDMLANGLREMDDPPEFLIWGPTEAVTAQIVIETDDGDVLKLVRGPDMERT